MSYREGSRRYLKGISYGKSLIEDSLSYDQAQKLKKELIKQGNPAKDISIRYSQKYEDYSVWSSYTGKLKKVM